VCNRKGCTKLNRLDKYHHGDTSLKIVSRRPLEISVVHKITKQHQQTRATEADMIATGWYGIYMKSAKNKVLKVTDLENQNIKLKPSLKP